MRKDSFKWCAVKRMVQTALMTVGGAWLGWNGLVWVLDFIVLKKWHGSQDRVDAFFTLFAFVLAVPAIIAALGNLLFLWYDHEAEKCN